jgi:DNA gyrase/topoisomerase IV subunit B
MNHFFLTIQITAPKEITILMSAISLGSETDSKDNSKIVYKHVSIFVWF